MALAEQLLTVAEGLAELNQSGRPQQAALRRAISTAYYSLYHLLIGAAAARMFRNPDERRQYAPLAIRGYSHAGVQGVVADALKHAGGRPKRLLAVMGAQPFDPRLCTFCELYTQMHTLREEADYNVASSWFKFDVVSDLNRTRQAFADWSAVASTDDAQRFLIALNLYARDRRGGD